MLNRQATDVPCVPISIIIEQPIGLVHSVHRIGVIAGHAGRGRSADVVRDRLGDMELREPELRDVCHQGFV